LIVNGDTSPVQVGIVSFGAGCGDRDYPGIYSRVSEFGDFIAAALADSIHLFSFLFLFLNNNDNKIKQLIIVLASNVKMEVHVMTLLILTNVVVWMVGLEIFVKVPFFFQQINKINNKINISSQSIIKSWIHSY